MRVQDIHGRWYELDDALLAQCEVEAGGEEKRSGTPADASAERETPEPGPTRAVSGGPSEEPSC